MSIATLGQKIAALVREKGWGQTEFSRQSGLNKLTCRWILEGRNATIRNQTVQASAKALGLMVNDLYDRPLEQLIVAIRNGDETLTRRYEKACQPELLEWMEANAVRAAQMSPDELDKLYSLQGTGGPLTSFGVEHFVQQIERQRQIKDRLDAVLDTEYIDVVETLVNLLWEKVQPYRPSRAQPPCPPG